MLMPLIQCIICSCADFIKFLVQTVNQMAFPLYSHYKKDSG